MKMTKTMMKKVKMNRKRERLRRTKRMRTIVTTTTMRRGLIGSY